MSIFNEEQNTLVCLERDRLIASAIFQRSPIMSKLLRYLVDQKLAGTDKDIKADTIAIEALGRSNDFDSSSDSYPRVQIGRLRKLLDRFYSENPSETRFDIPLNDYRIVLRDIKAINTETIGNAATAGDDTYLEGSRVQTPPIDKAQGSDGTVSPLLSKEIGFDLAGSNRTSIAGLKKKQTIFMSAICILLIGVAALYAFGFSPRGFSPFSEEFIEVPLLLVDTVESESDGGIEIASRTDAFLSDAFRRFDTIRLRTSAIDVNDNSASYRLHSKILGGSNGYSLAVQLFDKNEQLVWSRNMQINDGADNLDEELGKIVAQVSPIDGVIGQSFAKKYDYEYTPGYPCLVKAQKYLRYRQEHIFPKVKECIEESVRLAEEPATYLSHLSFLLYVESRLTGKPESGAKGAELAKQAIDSDPENAVAVFSSARTHFFAGDCHRGKLLAERALELNPYSNENISFTGVYLVSCQDPEAESYLRQSIALRPNQNTAIAVVLAFLLVREDRSDEAMDVINNIVVLPGPAEPQYKLVRALAYAKQGKREEARKMWSELARDYNLSSSSKPELVLQKFITSPSLIKAAVVILNQEDIIA